MMWLFVVAIFMPIMMGTCEETVANKTAVTWAHAVNSQEKLTHALDSKVNAIEADVVMGTLTGKRLAEAEAGDEELKKKDPKPPKPIPIMAHPPYNQSDLSLEDFLKQVTKYNHKKEANQTKAAKLDFKSTEAVVESVKLMKKDWKKLDSAVETTTNGSPLHEENGGNGDNGDSVASVSDAGSGTPPLQISQVKQQGSVDGDNNATNASTTPTTSIPLAENTLLVDISDALSEKDKVKFTVHTRTTFPTYAKKDFFVVRQHEEFIWLHDRYEENEEYAGYIIPPCPPRPDFDASREKLQRLGEGEGNMTKEEFKKMKQELEAEYLATFKKTVAMHEVFLSRLASHPVFRVDQHLKVFLEYDQDLFAKSRKKIDLFGGLVRSLGKTTDEIYLGATVRDVNDFFESEYTYLTELNAHLKEAATRTERMTKKHKEVADTHIKISSNLIQLSTLHGSNMEKFLAKSAEVFEKIRNMEGRVSSDQDLKLGDTLRYYQRDSNAAKALLVRRLRCLAAYETANRNLEKARSKNKDVHAAEQAQTDACEKFEAMSARGKQELTSFRARRVTAFKKALIELAELEVKHAKSQYEYLRQSVLGLRELA